MEDQISNNGWQNIGIMQKYATKRNLEEKYFYVYMKIIEHSFGYNKISTEPYTTNEWSKKYLHISRKAFEYKVHWLEENGFIKINRWTGFVKNGGSKPNTYSPVFPKDAHIHIADLKKDKPTDSNFKEQCDIAYDRMDKKIQESILEWNKKKYMHNKAKGIEKKVLIYDYFQEHNRQLLMYSDPEQYVKTYPQEANILQSKGLVKADIDSML